MLGFKLLKDGAAAEFTLLRGYGIPQFTYTGDHRGSLIWLYANQEFLAQKVKAGNFDIIDKLREHPLLLLNDNMNRGDTLANFSLSSYYIRRHYALTLAAKINRKIEGEKLIFTSFADFGHTLLDLIILSRVRHSQIEFNIIMRDADMSGFIDAMKEAGKDAISVEDIAAAYHKRIFLTILTLIENIGREVKLRIFDSANFYVDSGIAADVFSAIDAVGDNTQCSHHFTGFAMWTTRIGGVIAYLKRGHHGHITIAIKLNSATESSRQIREQRDQLTVELSKNVFVDDNYDPDVKQIERDGKVFVLEGGVYVTQEAPILLQKCNELNNRAVALDVGNFRRLRNLYVAKYRYLILFEALLP